MRILLIKPRWFHDGDGYKYKDLNRTAPLNLGIIAALSEGHEVKIIDEDLEEIKYTSDWDLVGITVATFTSIAAYKISENFRKRGVKTVLGGIHPSLMPEEGLKHTDIVVIGEAEPVWQKLLVDLERNSFQKIYNGNFLGNLDKVPFPRRDLFSNKYFAAPLQLTRGCTNSCKYCYLQTVPWGEWRKRDNLDRVCEEMEQIQNKSIFIVDDNMFIDHDYAKQILKRITPLKKHWSIQTPTTIYEDEELLDMMYEAGCYAVAIGFQSVSQKSLDFVAINQNKVEKYKEIIRKLKERKILVEAFFMFGFDTEDKNTFAYTADMIKELDIDDAICYILTPYPGTALFREFEEEGRILSYDWSKYSWWNCVYQPKMMSPQELNEGLRWIYRDLNKYYKRTFIKRMWQYKKRVPMNIPISKVIIKSYLKNCVDVTRLP